MDYNDEKLAAKMAKIEAKKKADEEKLLEKRRKVLAKNRLNRWPEKEEEMLEVVEMRCRMSIAEVAKETERNRHTVSFLEKRGLVLMAEYLRDNKKDRQKAKIAENYNYYEDLLIQYIIGNNKQN